MRLTLVSTGMVLDEVVIGGTWNRGMIGGTVAAVGLSRFEQGQTICWPFHADDWTETEEDDGATAARVELLADTVSQATAP